MNSAHYDHQKLQEARKKIFTQDELAKALECSSKTISRAETGESASYSLLLQIANSCKISIKEIIFDNTENISSN